MTLWAEVRKLPPRQRTVLLLRYVLDLTEQETAGLMGVSLGTVKSQHAKGIRALRDGRLSAEGSS